MRCLSFVLIFLFLCLVPLTSVAESESYSVQYLMIARIGTSLQRFSTLSSSTVKMPPEMSWSCFTNPTKLSSDGKFFNGGFYCVNSDKEYVAIFARCYSSQEDEESKNMILTGKSTDNVTPVIDLDVRCRTVKNSDNPKPFKIIRT